MPNQSRRRRQDSALTEHVAQLASRGYSAKEIARIVISEGKVPSHEATAAVAGMADRRQRRRNG